jgi:hypothetical protein
LTPPSLADELDAIDSEFATAVKTLYPDFTDGNRLSPALSLESYAGTYHNLGYQNITLELAKGNATLAEGTSEARELRLTATSPDMTWPQSIVFEHVTGEFWIAYVKLLTGPGTKILWEFAAVQFRLTPDGKTSQIGIEWQDRHTGVVDGLIWYGRVA